MIGYRTHGAKEASGRSDFRDNSVKNSATYESSSHVSQRGLGFNFSLGKPPLWASEIWTTGGSCQKTLISEARFH